MALNTPVLVLKDSLKRESGAKVHQANIQATKVVVDIIRTTLGPRSMLKMMLDAIGGIVVTNDGNAILREIDIAHPAAKSMSPINTQPQLGTWDSQVARSKDGLVPE